LIVFPGGAVHKSLAYISGRKRIFQFKPKIRVLSAFWLIPAKPNGPFLAPKIQFVGHKLKCRRRGKNKNYAKFVISVFGQWTLWTVDLAGALAKLIALLA